MDNKKFIIDTDIGDDVDDTLALIAAVKSGLDIIGITTVYHSTAKRAAFTKRYLDLLNVDIPIYAGYDETFSGFAHEGVSAQLENVDEGEYRSEPEKTVDFLIDSALKYGKDLTVIAIGPFTNVAAALNKNTEAFKDVTIVIMGGAYYKQYIDWNVFCDAKAAKILFEKAENLICVGADVTHRLTVDNETYERYAALNNPIFAEFDKDVRQKKKDWGEFTIMLHDPLAVSVAANEDFVEFENARIKVVDEGDFCGTTLNYDVTNKLAYIRVPESVKTVKVAKTVKKEEYIKRFFDLIVS